MSQPIAVVAADTHLDHLIWRTRPEITGDSYFGFQQVVDLAIDRKLPLILAGDVMELLAAGTPDSNTVGFLFEQAARLRRANRRVFAIDGQHDRGRHGADSWLVVTKLVDEVLHGQTMEFGGRRISFLSYTPARLLSQAIEQLPADSDVVVCHQVWKELMGGSSPEGSIADVPAPLVISGDLHQWKMVRLKKTAAPRIALSPGSTHVRSITEPEDHYAVVLHDDLSVKRVPLKSRATFRFQMEEVEAFEQLYSSLPEIRQRITSSAWKEKYPAEIRKPFMVIRDYSNSAAARERLLEMLGDDFHLFYTRFQVESDLELVQGAVTDTATSLRECAIAEIGDDPHVLELALELLDAEKPAQSLKQWQERFLASR